MSIFLKKVSFIALLLMAQTTVAQEIDIPLFPDEDIYEEKDHYQPKIEAQPQKKAPAEVKEEKPQIGRDAPMPSKIILTPPPLPEMGFTLTPEVPETPPEPKEPDTPIHLDIPQSQSIQTTPATVSEESTDVLNPQDARDFSLEGFALGMSAIDIGEIALKKGYKISKVKKEFPLFLTTRYEQECRLMGFYLPEEVRACMRQKGKEQKTIFVKNMTVSKPGTRESYFFEFTSPGTGNLVWRMTYTNLGDHSLNFNTVNTNKKLARQKVFFNAVYETFGYPDDAKNLIWGSKNDAFMQVSMYGSAYDAKITLTDVELSDEDYFDAKENLDTMEPLERFDFAM